MKSEDPIEESVHSICKSEISKAFKKLKVEEGDFQVRVKELLQQEQPVIEERKTQEVTEN